MDKIVTRLNNDWLWSSLVGDEGSISPSSKLLCLPQKIMQHLHDIIPFMFGSWANPFVHLLPLKSSMDWLLRMFTEGFYSTIIFHAFKCGQLFAVAVAQLADQSLLIPVVRGSNPKTIKKKKKRPRMSIFNRFSRKSNSETFLDSTTEPLKCFTRPSIFSYCRTNR